MDPSSSPNNAYLDCGLAGNEMLVKMINDDIDETYVPFTDYVPDPTPPYSSIFLFLIKLWK